MDNAIHPASHIRIALIVARSENGVIGNNNALPWHLPADLKHFKEITTGHAIIMGRKTHESIGRPLPNRTNIIITRDQQYQSPGCMVAHSVQAALERADSNCPIFIIGGSEIYRQFLPYADHIYLTTVHHSFEGDAFFPALAEQEWRELAKEEHAMDETNHFAYSFSIWQRI